jgi:hypothetical protein
MESSPFFVLVSSRLETLSNPKLIYFVETLLLYTLNENLYGGNLCGNCLSIHGNMDYVEFV